MKYLVMTALMIVSNSLFANSVGSQMKFEEMYTSADDAVTFIRPQIFFDGRYRSISARSNLSGLCGVLENNFALGIDEDGTKAFGESEYREFGRNLVIIGGNKKMRLEDKAFLGDQGKLIMERITCGVRSYVKSNPVPMNVESMVKHSNGSITYNLPQIYLLGRYRGILGFSYEETVCRLLSLHYKTNTPEWQFEKTTDTFSWGKAQVEVTKNGRFNMGDDVKWGGGQFFPQDANYIYSITCGPKGLR